MRLEHVAFALPDPPAAAAWYVEHLGFRVLRAGGPPTHAHFLVPDGGGTMLEIFCDAEHPPPDRRGVHPMHAHLAFAVEDIDAAVAAMVAAGGVAEGAIATSPAGDRYAIVRDPWGVPLQLITRSMPFGD